MSPGKSGDPISDIHILQESPVHEPNIENSSCMINRRARRHRVGIEIMTVNIQCLLAARHFAELCHQVELHRPHVVLIQETWLDQSTEMVSIPGYREVSRRDRSAGANRGGILTIQREDFNGLVKICDSEEEERS